MGYTVDILLMGISWKNHGDIMVYINNLGATLPCYHCHGWKIQQHLVRWCSQLEIPPWVDKTALGLANLAVKNPQSTLAVVDHFPFLLRVMGISDVSILCQKGRERISTWKWQHQLFPGLRIHIFTSTGLPLRWSLKLGSVVLRFGDITST